MGARHSNILIAGLPRLSLHNYKSRRNVKKKKKKVALVSSVSRSRIGHWRVPPLMTYWPFLKTQRGGRF